MPSRRLGTNKSLPGLSGMLGTLRLGPGHDRLQVILAHRLVEMLLDAMLAHRFPALARLHPNVEAYPYGVKVVLLREGGVLAVGEADWCEDLYRLSRQACGEPQFRFRRRDLARLRAAVGTGVSSSGALAEQFSQLWTTFIQRFCRRHARLLDALMSETDDPPPRGPRRGRTAGARRRK